MAAWDVIFKVGDQRPDFRGYRDGDLVCYYPAGFKYTEREHKEFIILRLEIDEKLLQQYVCRPYTYAEAEADITKRYAARLGYIDIDGLALKLGTNKVTDIRDKAAAVPVLTSPFLTADLIKNYRDHPRSSKVFRPGSIVSGEYSIGTGNSYDYSSIALFFAALGSLEGNLTGQIKTNTTETGGTTLTVAMNGYTLLLECDTGDRHSGYPTSGVQTTLNTTGTFIYDQIDTTGRLECRWLNLKAGASHPAEFFHAYSITVAHDFYIHHNLMDGVDNTGIGIKTWDADASMYVYGNVLWDFADACFPYFAFVVDENNTAYSCVDGWHLYYAVCTVTNGVGHDCSSADFGYQSDDTANYCASSDSSAGDFGTSNSCITGIGDADFVSVDDTNSGFLDVPSGSDLENAGTVGSYATVDIHGRTRTGTWDIGASQYEAPVGGLSMPVAMRHYRGLRVN